MSKETKNNKEVKNSKDKRHFFKDFKAELKKVTWPTPKQLANNTSAVIAIVVLTAIIVFALNITFEAMNKHGVDKVKELISNQTTNETTTDESNNNESSDDNSATNEADNNESADQNESAENNAASNE